MTLPRPPSEIQPASEPGPDEAIAVDFLRALEALARQDFAAAERLLRTCVAAAPRNVEALDRLGYLLEGQGRSLEAAEFICRAFVLRPAEGQSPRMRATAFYILGRTREAAEVYRRWVEAEPGNARARHHHAACSGEQVPSRASDAYVTESFDEHAERFDAHLESLGYQVPRAIAGLLARHAPPAAQWNALDAGCGTGLVGVELRPWTRRLAGVDLSAKMIERASARGVYDELTHMGIDAFLERTNTCYDLMVFADTLIYFGELAPTFARAAAVMAKGGWLAFNTELAEASETGNYVLRPSGRYAHADVGVREAMRTCGFRLLAPSRLSSGRNWGIPSKACFTSDGVSGRGLERLQKLSDLPGLYAGAAQWRVVNQRPTYV